MKCDISGLFLSPDRHFFGHRNISNHGNYEVNSPLILSNKIEADICGMLLRFVYICSLFGEVMMMNILLSYVDGKFDASSAIVTLNVAALMLIPLIGSLAMAHSDIMLSLSSTKYYKSLLIRVLHSLMRGERLPPLVWNDFINMLPTEHAGLKLITGPIQIIISVVLLYYQIGTALYVGIACWLLLFWPCCLIHDNLIATGRNDHMKRRATQHSMMEYMNKQAHVITDNLLDIASSRVLHQTMSAADKAMSTSTYLTSVGGVFVLKGLFLAIALTMLAVYVSLENTFDVATAFTSLGLLYLLFDPLSTLLTAYRRLQLVSTIHVYLQASSTLERGSSTDWNSGISRGDSGLDVELVELGRAATPAADGADAGQTGGNVDPSISVCDLLTQDGGGSAGREGDDVREVVEGGGGEEHFEYDSSTETSKETTIENTFTKPLLDFVLTGGVCVYMSAFIVGTVGGSLGVTAVFLIGTWADNLSSRKKGDELSMADQRDFLNEVCVFSMLCFVCAIVLQGLVSHHQVRFTCHLQKMLAWSSGGLRTDGTNMSSAPEAQSIADTTTIDIDRGGGGRGGEVYVEDLPSHAACLMNGGLTLCAVCLAVVVATKGILLIPLFVVTVYFFLTGGVLLRHTFGLILATFLKERNTLTALRGTIRQYITAHTTGHAAVADSATVIDMWHASCMEVVWLKAWLRIRVSAMLAGFVGVVVVIAVSSNSVLSASRTGISLLFLLVLRKLLCRLVDIMANVQLDCSAFARLRYCSEFSVQGSHCRAAEDITEASSIPVGNDFDCIEGKDWVVHTPGGEERRLNFTASTRGAFVLLPGKSVASNVRESCEETPWALGIYLMPCVIVKGVSLRHVCCNNILYSVLYNSVVIWCVVYVDIISIDIEISSL